MKAIVVDDQYDVVQGLLSGINWEKINVNKVYPAYNSSEAKNIFIKHNIDIVITDIEMPIENGLSMLKWMNNYNSDFVSLLLSAYAEFDYAKEALTLEVFEYIVQPAKYETIEKAIGKAIEKLLLLRQQNPKKNHENKNFSQKIVEENKKKDNYTKITEYINDNIYTKLTRQQIADAVYLNPEYLSRLFKNKAGISLTDYILERKIKEIKTLLTDTGLSIGVISYKIGYENFSYFSQLFKNHTGMTPNNYRKKHQK